MSKPKKYKEKPIDKVTTDRLGVVLTMCGIDLTDKELDLIIDAVELVENKGGNVTIDDIYEMKHLHFLMENT